MRGFLLCHTILLGLALPLQAYPMKFLQLPRSSLLLSSSDLHVCNGNVVASSVGSSRSCAISAHVDGDGEGNQAGGILRGSVYAITGNFGQRREETIKLMTGLGCQLSPTVHKKVAFVLCDDDALASGTKHVRKATKYGVPLVSLEYVEQCVQSGQMLRPNDFERTAKLEEL
mmetsp:Transcript_910/g.1983  ORF Transcript_910/g.1983 Transcript_910/m.1983 type:complete len:172 (+) Transcript_910:130-645(+)